MAAESAFRDGSFNKVHAISVDGAQDSLNWISNFPDVTELHLHLKKACPAEALRLEGIKFLEVNAAGLNSLIAKLDSLKLDALRIFNTREMLAGQDFSGAEYRRLTLSGLVGEIPAELGNQFVRQIEIANVRGDLDLGNLRLFPNLEALSLKVVSGEIRNLETLLELRSSLKYLCLVGVKRLNTLSILFDMTSLETLILEGANKVPSSEKVSLRKQVHECYVE